MTPVHRRIDHRFVDLAGRRSADPLEGEVHPSSIRLVVMEPVEGRTAHRHPHSEEIVYVEAGTGSVWIDGSLHPVGPGDVVVIPAGAAHATVPDSSMRLICFFPHGDLHANLEETDIRVS